MSSINTATKSGSSITTNTDEQDLANWSDYPAKTTLNMNGNRIINGQFDFSETNIHAETILVDNTLEVDGITTLNNNLTVNEKIGVGTTNPGALLHI